MGILFFTACEKEDHISESYIYSAALLPSNTIRELSLLDINAPFSTDLEVRAPENGKSVDRIDVYVTFKDLFNNGTDLSTSKNLLESISGVDVLKNIGETLRPVVKYSITKKQMIDTSKISNDAVTGGDEFVLSFTIVLKSGDEFTTDLSSVIVCPPSAPSPGTWILDMQDRFGDTWDGASLTISVDGDSKDYTMDSGKETQQFTFEVPTGANTIEVIYNIASFANEHTFQITSSTGRVVLDIGPSPVDGVQSGYDYCGF